MWLWYATRAFGIVAMVRLDERGYPILLDATVPEGRARAALKAVNLSPRLTPGRPRR